VGKGFFFLFFVFLYGIYYFLNFIFNINISKYLKNNLKLKKSRNFQKKLLDGDTKQDLVKILFL